MTAEPIASMNRVQHILSELPFFEEFTGEDLDYFSNNLSLRSFPPETCLFQEGDIGDYLFFVVNGQVEVKLESSTSANLVIAKFGPGSSIGEMSLIDDYPRSATIIVSEQAELLLLSRQRLESICKENPVIALKFMTSLAKTLSMRLRKANGRFADLA